MPRIQERIREQKLHQGSAETTNLILEQPTEQLALNSIFIKDNRMYLHKLARFYHTTYDIRRSEDVINPRTTHCDVMLLSDSQASISRNVDDPPPHPFIYARVLGIYHVNVVYAGPGMVSYETMHFDFLWVRWFQLDTTALDAGWAASQLDRVSFPPMAQQESFSFVNPERVLRGCHLVPTFSAGKRHLDGIGLSKNAKDGQEWVSYYVNR